MPQAGSQRQGHAQPKTRIKGKSKASAPRPAATPEARTRRQGATVNERARRALLRDAAAACAHCAHGFLGRARHAAEPPSSRPELSDTLVLINEFGDVGLDHLFVERIDGDMIVMSSGCVCCTIRAISSHSRRPAAQTRQRSNRAISPRRA